VSQLDDWQILRLPALAEKDDPLGREPGEALWPEWYPVEALEKMRALNERYFLSLYQQDPLGAVRPEFKREDIRLIKHARGVAEQWFWAFDLAATEKERSDYTAWLRGGRAGERLYIERCGRVKANWPVVKKFIEETKRRFPEDVFCFEQRFLELLAVQDMRSTGNVRVVYVPGDKEERSLLPQDVVSQGRLSVAECVDKDVDQRELFISELCVFPSGEHDDFVDCLSLLAYVLGFERSIDCLMVGNDPEERAKQRLERDRRIMERVGDELG